MSISFRSLLAPAVLIASAVGFAQSSRPSLHIDGTKNISPVSPTLYGLMTEEINYSYDGGLYAEMLRNRTFLKDWQGYQYWSAVTRGTGRVQVDPGKDGPSKALASSLQLTLKENSAGNEAGLANEGYWGMAVTPATTYAGSFYASLKQGTSNQAHARLIADDTGAVLAEATVPVQGAEWKRYAYTLKAISVAKGGSRNHFELTFDTPGVVELQLVSLMPPTFNNRPNGNRIDLMKKMAAMKPNFLRLPGGNYLEGNTIDERFKWKETIGPLVDRPTHPSPWGYQSTDGMGLLEFLEWCEDLKIEPVLAVYAGFSLKGEHVLPGKDLEPYVQEALDEIEYVNGGQDTKWGARRAKDGHPAPFPLHYIEIGNEDWLDKSKTYDGRFAQIARAIRSRYQSRYQLIATQQVKQGDPDVIDDHYYKSSLEFFDMVHQYDKTDRKGPKIFVGEWATISGGPTPNFGGALGDAAWMTGMERNSDVIVMASYAPIFTNVNPGGMQWATDLMGYTADKSYGSPSYWAQVMFAQHLGDHTVDSQASDVGDRFFWSATVSTEKKTLHLKLVNASNKALPLTLDITGAGTGVATLEKLSAGSYFATNSITNPDNVKPVSSRIPVKAAGWKHTVDAFSIEVLDITLR